MNITLLAAEIASLVPEMAKDSVTNNETLIRNLIQRESDRRDHWIFDKQLGFNCLHCQGYNIITYRGGNIYLARE